MVLNGLVLLSSFGLVPVYCSCANGADDDLFWMYFTVSSDGGGGGGGEEVGNGSVGDSGAARLTVVSNDEMRNHRMALLEPVPFKR